MSSDTHPPSQKRVFAINHNIPVCESTRHLFPIGSKWVETIKDFSRSTAGNVGNSSNAQVFLQSLNVETIEGIQTLYGLTSAPKRLAREANTEFDLAVLFLQDHIRPSAPYDTMPYARVLEFLRQLKIPVVTVGLGVNGFDLATINKSLLTQSIGERPHELLGHCCWPEYFNRRPWKLRGKGHSRHKTNRPGYGNWTTQLF